MYHVQDMHFEVSYQYLLVHQEIAGQTKSLILALNMYFNLTSVNGTWKEESLWKWHQLCICWFANSCSLDSCTYISMQVYLNPHHSSSLGTSILAQILKSLYCCVRIHCLIAGHGIPKMMGCVTQQAEQTFKYNTYSYQHKCTENNPLHMWQIEVNTAELVWPGLWHHTRNVHKFRFEPQEYNTLKNDDRKKLSSQQTNQSTKLYIWSCIEENATPKTEHQALHSGLHYVDI